MEDYNVVEEREEEEGWCWLVTLFVGHIFKPNKSLQYIKLAHPSLSRPARVLLSECVCAFSAKGAFQRGKRSGNDTWLGHVI